MFVKLIQTLETVANDGPDAFYDGKVSDQVVRATGGMLTREDLKSYAVVERKPIQTRVGDFMVMSSPAPSSGPKLLAFLNTMESFLAQNSERQNPYGENYIESVAQILSNLQPLQLGLGDPKENSEVWNRTEWMLNKDNING